MGRSCLSQLFMLKAFFGAALCSFILAGQMHAQEVIVAREKKAEAPKQVAPSSEQTPSESPAPARNKPKSREKKSSSALPTAEQMRMAGALAAERLESRGAPQQSARTGESDSKPAATETPVVSATAKPIKKETPTGEASVTRRPNSRTTKLDAVGSVRPTMMESGRQEPSATPSEKAEGRGQQSPSP